MEDELSLSLRREVQRFCGAPKLGNLIVSSRPKPLPPAEEQVPEATWNHLELPFEVVFSPPEGIEEEILEKLMDRSKKLGLQRTCGWVMIHMILYKGFLQH